MTRRLDSSLLEQHDALLFDLDGTLMHGGNPIPHAAEAIAATREAGDHVVFATNNASRTPQQAADHLAGIGIPAEPGEFITSPQVAVTLLAQRIPAGSTVLVVGGPALAAEVEAAGLHPVTRDDDTVAAVIQGWAPELDWARLAEGSYAIRRGATWMATNVDATLPTERGLAPGNGSMVAALRHATGVEPAVAGKPEPGMFTVAAQRIGARRPLVVGDRLDTDIEGANRAGMPSLLTLTGVDGVAEALRADPVRRPTWILPDLAGLTAPFALPVTEGERVRCGPVSATWDDGDVRLHGEVEDPRSQRAVLALLAARSAETAWTGTLRDTEGAELPLPTR